MPQLPRGICRFQALSVEFLLFIQNCQICQLWQIQRIYNSEKKVATSGPRPDDHWIKSLIPYPTVTAYHVLVRGLPELTFVNRMHNFTFWNWMIHLELIENDYKKDLNV